MDLDTGLWQMVELDDATQVGAARRMAVRTAEYAGFDETRAGRLALIVVELATNQCKHARGGRLFMRVQDDGAAVDVVAIDSGPGMNLERCFDDGYSTSGTAGTGLGAVRRAATLFDAYSDTRGSVLFARVGQTAGPRRGSLAIPVKGELASGDRWQWLPHPAGWSAAVIDGVGHGPEAAVASNVVAEVHAARAMQPAACLAAAHERSSSGRGAAASIVVHDTAAGSVIHAGVGNVAVALVGMDGSRGLASQNGTLGGICPTVREQEVPVAPRTLVVMHSDGLSARWSIGAYPGLRLRHPQVIAAILFRDACRTRDDATVLVIETGAPA